MHAVPTKAPGDAQRMHSVLHGFFMGPVTGEEKKRRIMARIKGEFFDRSFPRLANVFVDERETAPPISSYLLTQEQLLENEYPVPTWMLDSPQVGDDWLQIPEFTGNPNDECRVLALDCEMVSTILNTHYLLFTPSPLTVYYNCRKGTYPSLHHRLRYLHQVIRRAGPTIGHYH